MSDNNYQEVIKNNKLFDGIPSQNLKISFRNEQILRRKEGEIIFQKGDESHNTYLIVAGRVKIKVYIENKSVKLNKTINDFFGEIEVLEDTYRRSAAVANTDCILYVLPKSDLRAFLADNPEINDNIIAYNKVEIPELQITINPGLLKEDTDKLYITPPPENKTEEEAPEDSGMQSRNELEDKRREIEKTAEMILEISGDEEEFFEDGLPEEELKEDELPGDELTEDKIPDYDITPDDLTAEDNLLSSDETMIEETAESKDDSEPEEAEIPAESIPPAEESLTGMEDPDVEGNLSLTGDSEENTEEKFAAEELSLTSGEIPVQETKDESKNREVIEESGIPAEESNGDKPEEFYTEDENGPDGSVESVDGATVEIQEEALEEEELIDKILKTHNSGSEPEPEEGRKWFNLNSNETDNEIPDDLSEEEKLRYEAEDARLKYDDTEINTERILNAIRRIYSSFDKQSIYSNIVREVGETYRSAGGNPLLG